MSGDVVGVRLAGRRFKPVALGITVMMLGLVVAGLWNLGGYDYPMFQRLGALVPLAAAVMLTWGWWKESDRLAQYGLLVAFFSYLGRSLFLAIEDPLGDSLLLALGTTIIIGGTYVLEVQNRGVR